MVVKKTCNWSCRQQHFDRSISSLPNLERIWYSENHAIFLQPVVLWCSWGGWGSGGGRDERGGTGAGQGLEVAAAAAAPGGWLPSKALTKASTIARPRARCSLGLVARRRNLDRGDDFGGSISLVWSSLLQGCLLVDAILMYLIWTRSLTSSNQK